MMAPGSTAFVAINGAVRSMVVVAVCGTPLMLAFAVMVAVPSAAPVGTVNVPELVPLVPAIEAVAIVKL